MYGLSTFLEFDIPVKMRFVNSIGLANTHNGQAMWIVRRDSGKSPTKGEYITYKDRY